MNFGNFNNGRRLTRRQTVRLMVGLTILAWATQTLLAQWGFGQVPGGSVPATQPIERPSFGDERFLPGTARFAAGATLELRTEASIMGPEVKLRHVCRWSDTDAAVLAPIADFTLTRIAPNTPFRSLSLTEIKATLQDGGVSLAAINFVGAAACTISRTDVEYDERVALQQWIDAKQAAVAGASSPVTQPAEGGPQLAASQTQPQQELPQHAEVKTARTLRDVLTEDLLARLALPAEALQLTFRGQDQKLLNLAEPHFQFDIQPQRVRNLGDVAWTVRILTDTGTQKATVAGTAKAWQHQAVVVKPILAKGLVGEQDVVERRTLVDRLPDEPLLTKAQVVGQQASRDLLAGTVLTGRMVDPVQLVKTGQYVTVSVHQGAIQLKTVAKAMESGSMGQVIRVKNETTRDVFQVTLTGPQTAVMTPPGMASVAHD